jgi:VanZ family protein
LSKYSTEKAGIMTKKMLNTLYKYHIISILSGLLIFVICIIKIPQQDNNIQIPNFDKIVHFTMYLVLTAAFIFESTKIGNGTGKNFLRVCLMAFLWSAFLGGMIELAQAYFTNYRSGEWADWFCDLSGSLISCSASGLIRHAFR